VIVDSKHHDVLAPAVRILGFPLAEIGFMQMPTREHNHHVAPLDFRAQPALPVLPRVDPLIAMRVPRIDAKAPQFVCEEAAELPVPGGRVTKKDGDAAAGAPGLWTQGEISPAMCRARQFRPTRACAGACLRDILLKRALQEIVWADAGLG
jgi:hypothetical protein